MNAIMAFSVRMRALMVAFFVLVMIAGGVAFTRLNIEAYPDPIPPLVDIVTQNPGQSAEEIERYHHPDRNRRGHGALSFRHAQYLAIRAVGREAAIHL
jgi:hypothetical protein